MIRAITSTYLVLPIDNIDTDIIIPARFLKVTGKAGLGRHLFANWRYAGDGSPRPDFVLNRPDAAAARVLVAGDNFGCGSSREHAPWALADFGFRAVVSTSFASIFRNNCLKNGLLPIAVGPAFHRKLVEAAGGGTVTIDLEARTVTLADGTSATFPIEPFPRYCLLNGLDELSFLLQQEGAIAAFERGGAAGS
ncbi:MAG TPA: 3-isopropylmalate dehydratase small subunit [Candidatus Polarisedimenticolia bacterium]|jgi:3-isopropylmalate/(R)-2-methylmalate dehydratase small subunit|nr:3-isopropylmalate dehydratase small subunit [Candidatus Polarisedimenticolia bacterium]